MNGKSSLTQHSPRSIKCVNLSAITENSREDDNQNDISDRNVKKFAFKHLPTVTNLLRLRRESITAQKDRKRSQSLPGTEETVLPDTAIKVEKKRFTFGGQVRGLIKARNAFRRCLNTSKVDTDQEPCPEIVEIKTLPVEPRFASTLSVEAQYAIMKGYEDNVYDWLSDRFPDKKRILHRNRTPVMGVKVVPEPKPKKRDLCDKINNIALVTKAVQKFKKSINTNTTTWGMALANTGNTTNTEGNESKPDSNTVNQTHTDQSTNKKRLEVTDRTSSDPSLGTDNIMPPIRRTRSESLPCVPTEARLVMTNRYQIVMDIFDQLRQKEGVNPLSPRRVIKVNGQAPVREFNTWSQVWQKDFLKKYELAKTAK